MTKSAMLTGIAMVAFAWNSILCRLALDVGLIDAASFSITRVTSGAAALALLAPLVGKGIRRVDFHWRPATALAGYLLSFSYGYLSLSTATGALILFGTVQLTMLAAAWRRGERFGRPAQAGFTLALLGLLYLLAPGIEQPSPGGAMLMALSGLCWGIYSLSGGSAGDPLARTAANFLVAAPITLLLSAPTLLSAGATVSTTGLLLGAASGILASACGYAVWFAALPHLSSAQAAVVQLAVPVIAAVGGLLLLSEPGSVRLLVAATAILAGIWLVLARRHRG